jgi:hypothetical protein
LTNIFNETLNNFTIYFELPEDSIVDSLINFKDSKVYFTINSLAPEESTILNYSFLTKSNEDLSANEYGLVEIELSTTPLTAFISLAKNNKEITLIYLGIIIASSFFALLFVLRTDLLDLVNNKLKN